MTEGEEPSPSAPPWDDDFWLEPSDTEWRRGCRWLQSWWRETDLALPAGPHRPPTPGKAPRRTRPVTSALPLDVDWSVNYLTPEAAAVAERLVESHAGRLVDDDRLRRNLLSSQPVCVNLFAPLARHPDVIATWLARTIPNVPADIEVASIEFEWAPPPEEYFRGGSAFDAFVVYRGGGRRGFVAIETKYAEDLAGQAPKRIRDVYVDYTRDKGWWRDGAEHRLMAPATRQFWLNVLLAQSLVDRGNGFDEGCSLVLTCHDDRSALDATVAVASELIDDSNAAAAISPQWSSFEDVLAASDEVRDLDAWRSAFRRRYLDFTPVHHKLGPGDPRGHVPSDHGLEAVSKLAATTSLAWAVAERVVGQDSILARGGAESEPPESLVDVLVATRRLDEAIESVKGARVRGSHGLASSDTD